MLDKEKGIDAVTVVIPDHMHTHVGARRDAARQARLRREAADAHAVGGAPADRRRREDTRSRRRWATRATRTTRRASPRRSSGPARSATSPKCVRSAGARAGRRACRRCRRPRRCPTRSTGICGSAARAMRPYTSGDEAYRKEYPNNQFGFYLPFNWRGFYDFGSSLIGDWGIHQLGPANLALRLGSPISVECLKLGEGQSPYTFPRGGVSMKWEFAARENMPPVAVYWSDTGDLYTPDGHDRRTDARDPGHGPADREPRRRRRRRRRWAGRAAVPLARRRARARPPRPLAGGGGCRRRRPRARRRWRSAAGQRLQHRVRRHQGLSSARADAAKASACCPGRGGRSTSCRRGLLTRSPGHQRDWVRACKGGEPACSNFGVAGPYTEWMVLGAVAARVAGQAAVGSEEDGVHEQPRGEQVRPARVPQGLGAEVTHLDSRSHDVCTADVNSESSPSRACRRPPSSDARSLSSVRSRRRSRTRSSTACRSAPSPTAIAACSTRAPKRR